ncbi:MAG: tetrahydrofolate dehydrogenase/cyclohydrolase catalytic domain-containing protein [Sutterella wadsworthensis]
MKRAQEEKRGTRRAPRRTPPGLAVVLVGEDPASCVYVRNKTRACNGRASPPVPSSANTDQALLDLIGRLNADPAVGAILVQLPLRSRSARAPWSKRLIPARTSTAPHALRGRASRRPPRRGFRPARPRAS